MFNFFRDLQIDAVRGFLRVAFEMVFKLVPGREQQESLGSWDAGQFLLFSGGREWDFER